LQCHTEWKQDLSSLKKRKIRANRAVKRAVNKAAERAPGPEHTPTIQDNNDDDDDDDEDENDDDDDDDDVPVSTPIRDHTSHVRRANKPFSSQNINGFAAFIQGYKKLQSDNAHLQAQVAEQVDTIEQAQKFFCDAEDALEERKARDEEIELMRKEKKTIKEHNEELVSEKVSLSSRCKKLADFSRGLSRRVRDLEEAVKASTERLEAYKKRVKSRL